MTDSIPMTTIRNRVSRTTEITVGFGVDRLYDLRLFIDPARIPDDDHAPDGVARPAARMTLGGLCGSTHDGDQEASIERYLGEDELRAMGKALLTAAGRLRRIESNRRRNDHWLRLGDDESGKEG